MYGLKRILWILSTFWSISFLGQRILLLRELWIKASKKYDDDMFMQGFCANPNIRTNLGYHAQACDHADLAIQTLPLQNAFKQLFEQSHLCGNTSCITLLQQLSYVLVLILFLLWLFWKRLEKPPLAVHVLPREYKYLPGTRLMDRHE